MPSETEIQRYKIETNAAAFLQMREDIEKTPVGADFMQSSGKYPETYSSVTVVENSYPYQGRSLVSITTSSESDLYTLQAMGHHLSQFLGGHGITGHNGGRLIGGAKLGQDAANNHNYYELQVNNPEFSRARQLTHDLLATGYTGITPQMAAETRLISKAEYEATLPPGKRGLAVPRNTAEYEAWIASIAWPPGRTTPVAEAPPVAEKATSETPAGEPGKMRKFIRSLGFKS